MIGYYIHHQGAGHAARASAIARVLGVPVTALSTLPAPGGPSVFAGWVELARDDDDPAAWQHGAGGALHWAPLGAPGYRARMGQLSTWLTEARPDLVVVDVSVEVTALCRLHGIPVVVVAGAGSRTDEPHELAYRLAERILAPWPGELYRPAHLSAFASKTAYAGAFSRFDGLAAARAPDTRSVLGIFGRGGADVTARQLTAARDATPGWTWRVVGGPSDDWCDDVWAALTAADVVVTHAGMNALAEVAAAQRPAMVLPQPRPFDEQLATATVLRDHRIALVEQSWPEPARWPALLDAALELDGSRWTLWNDRGGARRAAELIAAVLARVRRHEVSVEPSLDA